MTVAATAIVNQAFAQLGEDEVSSVDMDPAPSRLIKILPHLAPAIDAVLVKYGWLCALEYATLAPAPLVPTNWKFPFAYLMPAGGLRFWEVGRLTGWERGVWENPDGATVPILRAAEGGDLNVAYVKRRAADALDANVRDAVVFELAARACHPIKGDAALAVKLREIADKAVLSAMGTDGQDAKGDPALIEDRLAALRATAQ